jgi:hypothetical protein
MGFGSTVYSTTNGKDWGALPGGPRSWVIGNDGKYLYAAFPNDYSGRPIWRAPLNELGKWTNMEDHMDNGPGGFGYDADHHILYAASYNAGMWRMRTE